MTIEALLDRLDGVRETGSNRFIARCPAHPDRTPSLAVSQVDDGRVLIHCFAGCEPETILGAVGLGFADVMPDSVRKSGPLKPVRQRLSARDALAALDHESLVVAIIGSDFLKHREIDEPTLSRLAAAVDRISNVRAECAPARIGR
jgi:hypothetical protein